MIRGSLVMMAVPVGSLVVCTLCGGGLLLRLIVRRGGVEYGRVMVSRPVSRCDRQNCVGAIALFSIEHGELWCCDTWWSKGGEVG